VYGVYVEAALKLKICTNIGSVLILTSLGELFQCHSFSAAAQTPSKIGCSDSTTLPVNQHTQQSYAESDLASYGRSLLTFSFHNLVMPT